MRSSASQPSCSRQARLKARVACRISPNCGIEVGGRLGPVRLVVGIDLAAKALGRIVEDDGEVRRLVAGLRRRPFLHHLPHHVAEAEHGAGRQPVGLARHRRQRVEGAEDEAGAVDQDQVVAGLASGLWRRAARGALRGMADISPAAPPNFKAPPPRDRRSAAAASEDAEATGHCARRRQLCRRLRPARNETCRWRARPAIPQGEPASARGDVDRPGDALCRGDRAARPGWNAFEPEPGGHHRHLAVAPHRNLRRDNAGVVASSRCRWLRQRRRLARG